jgi:hypothetical protein
MIVCGILGIPLAATFGNYGEAEGVITERLMRRLQQLNGIKVISADRAYLSNKGTRVKLAQNNVQYNGTSKHHNGHAMSTEQDEKENAVYIPPVGTPSVYVAVDNPNNSPDHGFVAFRGVTNNNVTLMVTNMNMRAIPQGMTCVGVNICVTYVKHPCVYACNLCLCLLQAQRHHGAWMWSNCYGGTTPHVMYRKPSRTTQESSRACSPGHWLPRTSQTTRPGS